MTTEKLVTHASHLMPPKARLKAAIDEFHSAAFTARQFLVPDLRQRLDQLRHGLEAVGKSLTGQDTTTPPTMIVPVISTAHLTEEEAKMDPDDLPIPAMAWEYGIMIYLTDDHQWSEGEQESFPGFSAAAAWAKSQNLSWIRFDRDYDEIPQLPTYNW